MMAEKNMIRLRDSYRGENKYIMMKRKKDIQNGPSSS